LNERGNLLAVGSTVISSQLMKQFKRGVAVKVREGINSRHVSAL
jgi:archaeosine-15-forming tRNA-guanine transglycosylase